MAQLVLWEYLTTNSLDMINAAQDLSFFGAQGWELVSAFPDGLGKVHYCFKRPL